MDIREDSGSVSIDSKLVSFLYELMRDHVTPGAVEEIMKNCGEPRCEYSNGWLTQDSEG